VIKPKSLQLFDKALIGTLIKVKDK